MKQSDRLWCCFWLGLRTTNDFHDIFFHVGCHQIIGSGTRMFRVTQSLRQLGGNGGFSDGQCPKNLWFVKLTKGMKQIRGVFLSQSKNPGLASWGFVPLNWAWHRFPTSLSQWGEPFFPTRWGAGTFCFQVRSPGSCNCWQRLSKQTTKTQNFAFPPRALAASLSSRRPQSSGECAGWKFGENAWSFNISYCISSYLISSLSQNGPQAIYIFVMAIIISNKQ